MADSAEVLGSEVLRFELLSEFSGPDFYDGEFALAGAGSVTLGTARVIPGSGVFPGSGLADFDAATVRPARYTVSGAASLLFRAGAWGTATVQPAGLSSLTLRTAMVIPGDVQADGATALLLETQALKDGAFAAAGAGTLYLVSGATAGSLLQSAGAADAIFRISRVIPCDFNSENIARVALDGVALVGLIPINPDDMRRPAEYRKMMLLPDNRRMQVPAILPMTRPTETRRMERA